MSDNTNTPENKCCPGCGNASAFNITGTSTFRVRDGLVGSHFDAEFDDDSAASCTLCDWSGKLRDLGTHLTDADRLRTWLTDNPDEAYNIAEEAVLGLWAGTRGARVLADDEDFPSGATYIDNVSSSFPAELDALIETLQKKNKREHDQN